ncbi:MAG: bifunctional folylpolyglutamate synthase/dihydrofolate synthase [Acidimicrobiia bacterium]|nr:bifunctional folylpolyglutamate synthase/dihydrofolate synthase [Acidimicrobiia bacterium]
MTPHQRLFALEQFGIKLGLDNIRVILASLGHPECAYRSIHIAGTNGKGSVAAMVERGLRAAGWKTGRYTSPHLDRVEERVAIDGTPIDRPTFAQVTSDVFDAVDAARARGDLTVTPTFFEVSTAVAFEIFKRAGIDVAIVEVGLGGRYDATNVLTPAITAITSIAFDHERHLGSTLSAIAFEKAGIAKRGVPLVIGRLPPEAAQRVRGVAHEVEAPVFEAPASPTDPTYPSLRGLTLALPGRHQLENATVAVAILERWSVMVRHVPAEAVVTGLTECEWPARLEWLRVPPMNGELLIDAAHNPAGAAALASYLQDMRSEALPIVFAAMRDKDLRGMIAALEPVAAAFVTTTVPHARARSAEQLAAEIRSMVRVPVEPAESATAAVDRALEWSRRAVACGSIYMIGPLRARLLEAGATRV